MKRLAILACGLFLGACGDSGTALTGGGGDDDGDPGPVVRFIVLGDTGAPAPDGESENVAAVVEKVCAQRGCDFATIAGDNIYEMGAVSEFDPLFDLAFQTPYANLDFPFFMALGNHDNAYTLTGEGGANFKGDFQVDYHSSPLNTDGKWYMRERYYSVTWPMDAAQPVMELFVIDSSPITHFYDDPDPNWSGSTLETYITAQEVFLRDGMNASPARWKFAVAHHPYISNGDHGNAGQFDVGAAQDPCTIAGPLASASCRGEAYKTFLENTICGRADVFFNGHDHNLYWLQPVASCGKTQHILSGAGSKARTTLDPERNAVYFQTDPQAPELLFGFVWVELVGDTLKAAFYTVEPGGTPTDVDDAGNPLPAFEKSFSRGATN